MYEIIELFQTWNATRILKYIWNKSRGFKSGDFAGQNTSTNCMFGTTSAGYYKKRKVFANERRDKRKDAQKL